MSSTMHFFNYLIQINIKLSIEYILIDNLKVLFTNSKFINNGSTCSREKNGKFIMLIKIQGLVLVQCFAF